jgi:hypothetical protein
LFPGRGLYRGNFTVGALIGDGQYGSVYEVHSLR